MVLREELGILASCRMRRNSVLEELRVSRLTVIKEKSVVRRPAGELNWIENQMGGKGGRSVCHLHDARSEMK